MYSADYLGPIDAEASPEICTDFSRSSLEITFTIEPTSAESWQASLEEWKDTFTIESLHITLSGNSAVSRSLEVEKARKIYFSSDYLKTILKQIDTQPSKTLLDGGNVSDSVLRKLCRCLVAAEACLKVDDMLVRSLIDAIAIYTVSTYDINLSLSSEPSPEVLSEEADDGLPDYQLERALAYIHANLGRTIQIQDIASELNISQFYFSRLFKISTGLPPYQYIIRQRVNLAKQLLKNSSMSLSEIALDCGLSQSQLCYHFNRQTGCTPNSYRTIARTMKYSS